MLRHGLLLKATRVGLTSRICRQMLPLHAALALILALGLALTLTLTLVLRLSRSAAFRRPFTFFSSAFFADEAVAAAILVCPGEEETKEKDNQDPGDNFVAENSLD